MAMAPAPADALAAAVGLLDKAVQCADISRLPRDVDAYALIPYLPLYYCLARPAGAVASAASAAAVLALTAALFRALGATAEVYLGPTMTGAALALALPPRLAGATLLALVNGAPDIAASVAAVRGGHVELAFGALAGAGLFVGCVVGGAVVRVARGAPARGALVRDACAYGIAVATAAAVLASGSAGPGKAGLLLALYAAYVAAVAGADAAAAAGRRRDGGGDGAADPLLAAPPPPVADLPPALAPRVMRGGSPNHRSGGEGLELSLSDGGGRLSALLQSSRSEPVERAASELQWRPATATAAYAPPDAGFGRVRDGGDCGEGGQSSDGERDDSAGGGGGAGRGGANPSPPTTTDPNLPVSPFAATNPTPPSSLADRALAAVAAASAAADRAGAVLDAPFALALAATVPVVADEPVGGRAWLPTALALGPPTAAAYLGAGLGAVAGTACAGGLAGAAAAASRFSAGVRLVHATPRFVRAITHAAAVAAGVAASVLWVGALASELVGCLQFIGVAARVPPAVLGGTLLAWGNSIGDLATNVAVARSGLPNMALTACFAGPATNLLLGLGGGLAAGAAGSDTGRVSTSLSAAGAAAAGFVGLMVAVVLACAALFGRRLPPASSWAFLTVYAAYVITSIALAVA